ncbi:MAG: hypothetical protein IAE91_08595 [Ignavibacteriaceae bacterium]|nr:hypothetical protein [Ignavibacteriaceae bacterium]
MNRQEIAHVELTLTQQAKEYLNDVVSKIVSEIEYYYSPVVPRIKGNVTDNAHLTFFYGLKPEAIENADLNKLLSSVQIKELKLKELSLLNGFESLYKILIVTVDDSDKTLSTVVNKIRKFSDRPNSYEFKPHITLAYVSSDYELPSELPILRDTVATEEFKTLV